MGEILFIVPSSDIASLLLPGGKIAHCKFAIALNPSKDSICNTKQERPLTKLIIKTKLTF